MSVNIAVVPRTQQNQVPPPVTTLAATEAVMNLHPDATATLAATLISCLHGFSGGGGYPAHEKSLVR